MLAEGTMLGKYKVVRLLGTGGMADVYEAEDSMLGRRVALKVLPPEFARDEQAVARFEKEVRAAASLNHANIVSIFEVDRADDIHFCAMRLLRGGDLRARIDKGLSESEAVTIAREIAQAFVHAHAAGFVHRDVKPENILFDEQGRAILTDFGIAKAIHSQSKMTATGVSIGTPRYISPEQARGQTVDGRSDLYSLGAILYEMLAGKPPFEAEDSLALIFKHVTEPVPRLPDALARYQPLIDSLMAKEPERRPENAAALVAMLNALPAPRQATPRPAAPAAPPPPPAATPAAKAPAAEASPKVATGERVHAERLVQEEQRQRESEARRRAAAEAAAPAPEKPAAAPAARETTPPRARRSVLASTPAPPDTGTSGPEAPGGSRVPLFVAAAAIVLGGGMLVWWLASQSTAPETEVAAAQTDKVAAVEPTATPEKRVVTAIREPAATPAPVMTPAPVATATPAPATAAQNTTDAAALRKAEAEKKRKQQEAERKRLAAATTPAPVLSKAERLARERKLCKRHVSDLFPGWDFTYADMAAYPGVKKLADGRLNTPPLASDYGNELRYEIDRNGCITAVLQ